MSEEHLKHELPSAISGPTSSISMGLNDSGQLDEVIFILGGCSSPNGYTPFYVNDDNDNDNDGSSDGHNNGHNNNLPFSEEYRCTQISSTNYVFDPKDHFHRPGQDGPTGENENEDETDDTSSSIYAAKEMPRPRHKHSSVSINGKIWLLGGRDENDDPIPQIDIYDSIQNTWITLGDNENGNETGYGGGGGGLDSILVPNHDVINSNSVPYNGVSDACTFTLGTSHIVLTGGFDANYVALGYTIIIDVDATLNTLNNSDSGSSDPNPPRLVYELASPLNVPRGGCAAVSHGVNVNVGTSTSASTGDGNKQSIIAYVSGGFTHADGYCEAMQSVERFDVEKREWILLSKDNANANANNNNDYDYDLDQDKMQREGVKSNRNTGLSIGRAHHSLFYYNGHIVAFGGEKRGTYDSSSGRCIDRYEAMNELTFDMNRKRPNRLTFPVDTDEIEILELVDNAGGGVQENDLMQWVRKKTVLENNEKLRFSIVSYPTLSKVFMFGGAYSDLEAITTYTTTSSSFSSSSGAAPPCTNCFTFSPDIDVFIDPLHDESRLFMNIVFLMILSLSFIIFMISTSKRCCSRGQRQRQQQQLLNAAASSGICNSGGGGGSSSNNNGVVRRGHGRGHSGGGGMDDARKNEKGMLIQDDDDGDFWGGDAFSTDLDVEEMEWNNDLEMREIT
mmetsp:Transcript_5705/g.8542  ORF Transcript_5705/g.8542 Transcript_5705/m.8542 type:complete len:677 (-) Transcript_5705:134-2164(-)|eukprot:CAMPEP_0203677512 /NCGR_PEP_ID=MMETSP0090-20130426/28459_1 /ASSEMBLY_ACC=CAM_ASM_001088 /TAXON_ID=426623 /ORGANISM="Chaetoceros affinis, Strain CCMP159" /LENGTH=676 /DNA_ID=CAMNT_0050544421 /DNA_START=195 /DNA_END=2225 /DNA_ORIENTATION=-